MARLLPTNNAVTNAVPANTPIAFCMTGISCVEWPDPAGPGPYGLVRGLDVRIDTTAVAGPLQDPCLGAVAPDRLVAISAASRHSACPTVTGPPWPMIPSGRSGQGKPGGL